MTGYDHPDYALSLAEFGTPLELPRSKGWLLQRAIPGTAFFDAMGCYPLFACQNWLSLHKDLEELAGKLVSVALVADPFGDYELSYLERCFDVALPFKEHIVADLNAPIEEIVSKHHYRYALKSLKLLNIDVCQNPLDLLEDWVALYRVLVERHHIPGIRAFSREVFVRQLAIPGLLVIRAEYQGVTVAANLFFIQGETAYDHLAASSLEGYNLRASYALKLSAINYFRSKVRWIDWGGGTGYSTDRSDGLVVFKRGWGQVIRQTYFCGKVLDPGNYRAIVKAKNKENVSYFPAYREGEFD